MRRLLALWVSFSLMTPAFARDDDRYSYSNSYRSNDFKSSFQPKNNLSPSFKLDRQIATQNAMLNFRLGQRVEVKTPSFSMSSIGAPTLPQPKFQFASLNVKPLDAFKINMQKIQPPAQAMPRGILGTIGVGLKAVVNTVTNAIQKLGQGLGNAIGKVVSVFTVDRAKVTYNVQRDFIVKQNPNLQEVGKGTFQVPRGQTTQFGGRTWESGSTFQMNAKGNIALTQGVTMNPDMGGIKRADGGMVPVQMVVDNGSFKPVGIDFNRVEPKTKFDFTHPVAMEGLGTIPAGTKMTYEAMKPGTKDDPAPSFVLSFQNAKIDNPGKALESVANKGKEAVTLSQMEIQLKGKLLQINGMHINKGNDKMFVSQYGESFSVTQLENKTAAATKESANLTQHSLKLTQDVTGSVNYSNFYTKKLHENTGTPQTADFQVRGSIQAQAVLSKTLEGKTTELNGHIKNGNYGEVANAVTTLTNAQNDLKNGIQALETQAETLQSYKRSVKGLEQAYGEMVGKANPDSMKTPTVTVEQINKAADYFPTEKKIVALEARNAINALQNMAEVGILSPAEAKLKCAEIMAIRNHLLSAKPDVVATNIIKTADTMEQGYVLLDHAADRAVFDHLDKLAETHPGVTKVIGQTGLAVAGGAAIVGVGYGLATAPATTVTIIGSGVISQKTFEAMGLSPRAAALYAAIVTAPVAAASDKSAALKSFDKQGTAYLANAARGTVKFIVEEATALGNIVRSEAGHILNPLSLFARNNTGVSQSIFRAARTLARDKKPIVLGESMEFRVQPVAEKLNFSIFKARSKNRANWEYNQRQWIREQIKLEKQIFDIGIRRGRTPRSPFYAIEREELKAAGYVREFRKMISADTPGGHKTFRLYEWVKQNGDFN